MPRFTQIRGEPVTLKGSLDKPELSLGRDAGCDIVLADAAASRRHAKLLRRDGVVWIEDLGSRNYTLVNQTPVDSRPLSSGDRILIGETEFLFEGETGETGALEFEARPAEEPDFCAQTIEFSLDVEKDLPPVHRDRERLALLYQLGSDLNAGLQDYSGLLTRLLQSLFRTLPAERAFVALRDVESGELAFEIVRDRRGNVLSEISVSKTILYTVVHQKRAILTRDALSDPRFQAARSVAEGTTLSALCVPLVFRGEVLGVFYADDRGSPGRFGDADLEFLAALGHLAAIAIGNARLYRSVWAENERLRSELTIEDQIVGVSPPMLALGELIRKVAPCDVSVLINGDHGTGKELVARALHRRSLRKDGPFVAVNCAAIPDTLFESELFGYAPSSGIAGADPKGKPGKLELASGGTLFLDEVGDMPLVAQVKILRTLQERTIERLSGTKSVDVDVRIISATNKDLGVEMKAKRFREDLFYRLRGIEMSIPPLRERPGDIELLLDHFLNRFAARYGKPVREFSPQARALLVGFKWPGNVRELENEVERLVVLSEGSTIHPEDLPYSVRRGMPGIPLALPPLKEVERNHIVKALRHTGWNITRAAEILGISRKTVHEKIKQYGLEREGDLAAAAEESGPGPG